MLTSGEQKRDFIFIDDFTDVCLKVMDKEDISGEILNVGTGEDSTIKETAKKICSLANSDENLLAFGQKNTREIEALKSWKADTSKIKKVLDYQPKYNLDGGLKKTIEWFTRNIHLYEAKS